MNHSLSHMHAAKTTPYTQAVVPPTRMRGFGWAGGWVGAAGPSRSGDVSSEYSASRSPSRVFSSQPNGAVV